RDRPDEPTQHRGDRPRRRQSFFTIRVMRSADGGRTWARTSVNSAQDGQAATNFRFDPRIAYDRFGNLFISYIGEQPAPLQHRLFLLQSNDKGATFGNVRVAGLEAGGSMDRDFLAIGPFGGNLAQDAVYVGWRDIGAFNGAGDKIVFAQTISTGA